MKVGAFQYHREFESPEVAHEVYHRQYDHDQYGLRIGLGVLDALRQSDDLHHRYDAGWQAIDLAEFSQDDDRLRMLRTAQKLWLHVANSSGNRQERLTAEFAGAFIPVYEAGEASEVDYLGLKNRLAKLLGKTALVFQKKNDPEVLGVANEVATAYLLARLAHKTNGRTPIAWPAKGWEDRHHGVTDMSAENFDLHVGRYPFSFGKVQVKSFLDQDLNKNTRKRKSIDGDRLLARWRTSYADGIRLIFGDVHLGNSRGSQGEVFMQLCDTDRHGDILRIATNNILDELAEDIIDLRSTQPLAHHGERSLQS